MNILISTGIYPPKTSGPAQYAKNMEDVWSGLGHNVQVKTFKIENRLPTGIRHMFYFIKIIPAVFRSDFVFVLDTFSVGFPTALACFFLNKKLIIRTGGDFLWEGYVERTGDLVLLRDFYNTKIKNLSIKEKIIFYITKWVLKNAGMIIFSTYWQQDIFKNPYNLESKIKKGQVVIIENRYGEKEEDLDDDISNLNFIGSTRDLKWKNLAFLKAVFNDGDYKKQNINLITEEMSYVKFMELMKKSYAVILASLGDISPHMILDAIRLNKPFIITEENGLMDRISDIAITINPKDENDIKNKINYLLNRENYISQVNKIKRFKFTHTWYDIANEILEIFNRIK